MNPNGPFSNSYGFDMLVLSVIYAVFLCLIFHSKKRINSLELKIFGYLIDINMVSSVFELFCGLSIALLGKDSIIAIVICRIYLGLLLSVNYAFIIFVIGISLNNELSSLFKRYFKIISFVTLFFMLFAFILPMVVVNDQTGMYSTGPATLVLLLYGVIADLILIPLFIVYGRRKYNVPFIKYISPLLVIIMSLLAQILTNVDHHYTLFSVLETFCLMVLFFTIQNPDVKTIDELEIAKNEAEKGNRAQEDFLASVSKEIRQPLNTIVGFSEDIKKRRDEGNAIIYENADYILSSSQKLLEMVDNFIDVSDMQANTLKLNEDVYNFNEAIMEVIKDDGEKIGDKNIEFLFNTSKDLPDKLIGDKKRVMSIVHNLLSNAIKYTNKGKIELSVRSTIEDDKCILVIRVSDTGKGIGENQLEKLFTMFERSSNDKNSTISGAGLGLAITKNLVELMGGKISVQSEVNNGSIFIVQIPQTIPNN